MQKNPVHPSHEEDVYAHDEQGIEKKLSKEEKVLAVASGDADADAYTPEGAESLRDDDEIDDWEEGFLEGASGKGQGGSCAHCGGPLPPKKGVVERMIDGELSFFCSGKCASAGQK